MRSHLTALTHTWQHWHSPPSEGETQTGRVGKARSSVGRDCAVKSFLYTVIYASTFDRSRGFEHWNGGNVVKNMKNVGKSYSCQLSLITLELKQLTGKCVPIMRIVIKMHLRHLLEGKCLFAPWERQDFRLTLRYIETFAAASSWCAAPEFRPSVWP